LDDWRRGMKTKARRFLLPALLLGLSVTISAQVDLTVRSGIEIPVSTETYSIANGIESGITLEAGLKAAGSLGALIDLGYSGHQFNGATDVSILAVQSGLFYRLALRGDLRLAPFVAGGYFYNWSPSLDDTGGNLLASAGAALSYRLNRFIDIRLKGAYRYYGGDGQPFFSSALISLGAAVSPWNTRRAADIEISAPEAGIIFPIYRFHYDEYPLSSVNIINNEEEPLTNVQVSFFLPDYMREPRICARTERIEPGKEFQAELHALLNEAVLDLTEGTRCEGQISIDYRFKGDEFSTSRTDTYEFAFRNGMVWDDDRSAACFVTARDPLILSTGKLLSNGADRMETGSLPEPIIKAAAVSAFVRSSGIRYTIDPTSPYSELSASNGAIDYLQYPSQTLSYAAGDCDDLSILYSALLESMGVSTAFVTVPGHIYIAFDSGLSEEEFARFFLGTRESITRDGRAWVPLEVTTIDEPFAESWYRGMQQWLEAGTDGGFYPVAKAWKIYPPVQPLFEEKNRFVLNEERITAGTVKEIDDFRRTASSELTRPLNDRLRQSPDDTSTRMRLGITLARFGFFDDAEQEFEILSRGRAASTALVNLANLRYLQRDFYGAAGLYRRAYDGGLRNPYLAAKLAEVYRRIGETGQAELFAAINTNQTSTGQASTERAASGEEKIQWIE
jgi:hypothetical protein